jgi:hypothetical protein
VGYSLISYKFMRRAPSSRLSMRTVTSILEASMTRISASNLKTQGIAAIEFALSTTPEAIVSVRGKDRFVVMDMARYHYLRECELDAALVESRADLAAGRAVQESSDDSLRLRS